MTSPEQLPTSAQTARRQLVRGVFAAPALLTVYSGGALAAGSAKRCLVNQTNTPTMVDVTGPGGSYLRVRLRKTGAGTSRMFWVRGADIQTFKKTRNTVHLTSTQWQPFDITTNLAGPVQESAPGNDSDSNKYAALRFDAEGNLKGVGISNAANQSAIANTCWQSVAVTL